MVQQKLDEARKEEKILKVRFEEARTEAINLSGQLAQIELLERDVKRLSDMNDVLLNQIASLDLKQNGQDVRVAVIEEPVVGDQAGFAAAEPTWRCWRCWAASPSPWLW